MCKCFRSPRSLHVSLGTTGNTATLWPLSVAMCPSRAPCLVSLRWLLCCWPFPDPCAEARGTELSEGCSLSFLQVGASQPFGALGGDGAVAGKPGHRLSFLVAWRWVAFSLPMPDSDPPDGAGLTSARGAGTTGWCSAFHGSRLPIVRPSDPRGSGVDG